MNFSVEFGSDGAIISREDGFKVFINPADVQPADQFVRAFRQQDGVEYGDGFDTVIAAVSFVLELETETVLTS
jgi:hypothetical protein